VRNIKPDGKGNYQIVIHDAPKDKRLVKKGIRGWDFPFRIVLSSITVKAELVGSTPTAHIFYYYIVVRH
jgi:hypothetical protein